MKNKIISHLSTVHTLFLTSFQHRRFWFHERIPLLAWLWCHRELRERKKSWQCQHLNALSCWRAGVR